MSRRFLIVVAVLIIGFGGIVFLTKNKASAPSDSGGNGDTQLSEHTIGDGKSGVTLIEYGDFQCPACYKFEPVMQQVREKYKDEITFQFRNFPLVEIHQNALIAARAAEAAAMQNKFWEMHDLLYQNQNSWASSSNAQSFFEDYAQQLGLNVEQFKTDMKSDETNRIVQADRSEAQKLGFSGTPSFLLDGKQLDSPRADVEYFTQAIDEAIKAKQGQ